MCVKSLQSCLTLCYPMDRSPPGSSVHGILQARMLEWVTIPFSRGSSWPRDWICVSYISCIGRQVFFTTRTPSLVRAILYPETDQYIIFQIQTLELPPPGSFPGLLTEPLIWAPAALPIWAFHPYLLVALYCELTFLRLSSLRVGPAATWVATFIMVLVSLCKWLVEWM